MYSLCEECDETGWLLQMQTSSKKYKRCWFKIVMQSYLTLKV